MVISTLAVGCSRRSDRYEATDQVATAPQAYPAPAPGSSETTAPTAPSTASLDTANVEPAPNRSVMPNGIDTSDLAILRRPKVVIKNGSLSLKSENYESSMDRVRLFTQHYGGYIAHEHVRTIYGDAVEAELTIKIPAQYFDTVLVLVKKMGDRVVAADISAQEMTEQYEQSRTNLTDMRAEAERLKRMINSGSLNAKQRLEYESRLSSLQYQIASQQSSHNTLVRSVTYSTLRIELNADQRPGPLTRIWQSIKDGLNAFVDILAKILAIIIGALPILALIALLVYLIVLLSRWMQRRENARTEHVIGQPRDEVNKNE